MHTLLYISVLFILVFPNTKVIATLSSVYTVLLTVDRISYLPLFLANIQLYNFWRLLWLHMYETGWVNHGIIFYLATVLSMKCFWLIFHPLSQAGTILCDQVQPWTLNIIIIILPIMLLMSTMYARMKLKNADTRNIR